MDTRIRGTATWKPILVRGIFLATDCREYSDRGFAVLGGAGDAAAPPGCRPGFAPMFATSAQIFRSPGVGKKTSEVALGSQVLPQLRTIFSVTPACSRKNGPVAVDPAHRAVILLSIPRCLSLWHQDASHPLPASPRSQVAKKQGKPRSPALPCGPFPRSVCSQCHSGIVPL